MPIGPDLRRLASMVLLAAALTGCRPPPAIPVPPRRPARPIVAPAAPASLIPLRAAPD